jgi:SulP family sulfate permease
MNHEITAQPLPQKSRMPGLAAGPGPAELLVLAGLAPDQAQRLLALVQPLALAAGDVLIDMDAPADEMFFVLRGRVTAVQDMPQGRVRLRTLTAGTLVGEMAIVQESGRAASVVADQPTQVLRITSALLKDLVHADPELAYGIQRLISRQLVDRLLQNQRSVLVLKH